MNMVRMAAALSAALVLGACAPVDSRLVDALDGPQFVCMSRAMRPVMLKKKMVDASGDWYSPLVATAPSGAGKTLVDRLSPAFRFSGDKIRLPSTFRAMLNPDAKVELDNNKAVIIQGLSRVVLELVAVTDWNNDGKDDWLVSCQVGYVDNPRRYREYYLTITNLESAVLEPRIQMILDHVYSRTTVVEDASQGELTDSEVVEFLPGQSEIMQKPDRKAVEKSLSEGSTLKKSALKD